MGRFRLRHTSAPTRCVIEWPEEFRVFATRRRAVAALSGAGRELLLAAGTPAGNACLAAFASTVS
jgi:hypothetical protein